MDDAVRSVFHTVDGVLLHALEAGAGAPIALLHPEPGDASTFAAIMPRLAQTYRVLALDLRGHGRSAKPRGDYSVPTQASFALRLLDAAAVDQVVLVGNSYGAIAALYIAAHVPDRIRALVLSGTTAYQAYHLPWKARVLASWPGRLLAPLVPRRAIERAYGEQFANPGHISPAQLRAVGAAFADPISRRCLWQQAHQLDYAAVEPLLGRVSMPVLLAWGREDRATPLAWARRLECDLPDARLAIIDDCGHYPALEQPEEFTRLTLEFLAQVLS